MMRSWFLRWISVGPGLVADGHEVLRLETWPCARAEQDVVDVFDAAAVLFAQPDDDRVFVAGLAEERRLRAADARADRVGDAGHRQAEQRRLRPVDLDRELRAARRRGRRGRCGSRATRSMTAFAPCATRCETGQVVALNLERDAASRRRRRGGSAAGCRRTRASWMMTPGMMPGSCRFRSRAICSLERVRLSFGDEPERHVDAVRAAATGRSRRRRPPG